MSSERRLKKATLITRKTDITDHGEAAFQVCIASTAKVKTSVIFWK